jgi:competence protein ComEA
VLKIVLGVVVLALVVFAVIYSSSIRNTPAVLIGGEDADDVEIYAEQDDAQGYEDDAPHETASPQMPVIVVYVSGHVYNPGVYALAEGARINDAVAAAGGLTETADPNAINLAAVVADEQHIIAFGLEDNMPPSIMGGAFGSAGSPVGSVSGSLSGSVSVGGGITADGRVNLNTATAAELTTLSGIGEVRAAAIIQHRDARGGFGRIEEIMNVSGIGESIFASVKDRIFVD